MTTRKQKVIGLGLVGCGDIGNFFLSAYREIPGLRLVAVTDTDVARRTSTADRHGVVATATYEALLARDDIDVIAICTPPIFHVPMAEQAFAENKHVWCEKPLATTLQSATHVVREAQRQHRLLGVDYVLRWNPLYWLLHRLEDLSTREGLVLGPLHRFEFENYAADERRPPAHWFWNTDVSGGMFVEHSVHFFDACIWLAKADPLCVQALSVPRPGFPHMTETTIASAVFPGGTTATFAHSFVHSDGTEAQFTHLDWGFAHAEVRGWIPLELTAEIWTDPAGAAAVMELANSPRALSVPNYPLSGQEKLQLETIETYPFGTVWTGRGQSRTVTQRLRLQATLGGEKSKDYVYHATAQAGMTDFVRAVQSGGLPSVPITDVWSSLSLAVGATESARSGSTVQLQPPPADMLQ